MVAFSHNISLSSPEETKKLAEQLSPLLMAGDTLLFEGPIGAGKSHFCRSLIQSILTTPEDIPSPTFTLVQTYEGPDFPIWHCDLYRLTHPDEAWELGLEEAFGNSLCLIEWPDRLANDEPAAALWLTLKPLNNETRILTIKSKSDRWGHLYEVLDVK